MLHGAKLAVSGLCWPAILAATASVARPETASRQPLLLLAARGWLVRGGRGLFGRVV